MRLRQLLCLHNDVHVIRKHADVVRPEERNKVLYIDTHNVWTFVQCRRCKRVFAANQHEPLFASKAR